MKKINQKTRKVGAGFHPCLKGTASGITLISLVVTIIVLLILTGVVLRLISGSDGILGRATNAVDKNKIAGIQEDVELAVAQMQSEYYEAKYIDRTTSGTFPEYATNQMSGTGYTTSKGATLTISGTTVTYTDKNGDTVTGTFDTTTGAITINGNITKNEIDWSSITDNDINIVALLKKNTKDGDLYKIRVDAVINGELGVSAIYPFQFINDSETGKNKVEFKEAYVSSVGALEEGKNFDYNEEYIKQKVLDYIDSKKSFKSFDYEELSSVISVDNDMFEYDSEWYYLVPTALLGGEDNNELILGGTVIEKISENECLVRTDFVSAVVSVDESGPRRAKVGKITIDFDKMEELTDLDSDFLDDEALMALSDDYKIKDWFFRDYELIEIARLGGRKASGLF